jgi:PIN domain nuclease of toxin-antitoxin system
MQRLLLDTHVLLWWLDVAAHNHKRPDPQSTTMLAHII